MEDRIPELIDSHYQKAINVVADIAADKIIENRRDCLTLLEQTMAELETHIQKEVEAVRLEVTDRMQELNAECKQQFFQGLREHITEEMKREFDRKIDQTSIAGRHGTILEITRAARRQWYVCSSSHRSSKPR